MALEATAATPGFSMVAGNTISSASATLLVVGCASLRSTIYVRSN